MVGLITGRASAAESDVLANARARWPAVRFRVAYAAVQGVSAVPQILDALALLDADPQVDVIVLARGGGSAEDLLPFSDEALCRAVAGCRTPVVAADRPRTRPSDRRRRRRRALFHPDRCRQAGGAGRSGRTARRRWPALPRAAGVGRLGTHRTRAARPAHRRHGAGRSARSARAPRRADRSAGRCGPAPRSRPRWIASTAIWRTVAPNSPHSARPRRWPGVCRGPGRRHVLRSVADAPAGAALRIRVADGAVLAVSSGPEPTGRPRAEKPEATDRPGKAPHRADASGEAGP